MHAWDRLFNAFLASSGRERARAATPTPTTSRTSTASPATTGCARFLAAAASSCPRGRRTTRRRRDGARTRQPQERRLHRDPRRGGRRGLPGVASRFLDAPRGRGTAVAVVSSLEQRARRARRRGPRRPVRGRRRRRRSPPREGLPGKPAPDTFVHAAELLGVPTAQRCVVARGRRCRASRPGRAGDFGLVVGVDRGVGRDGRCSTARRRRRRRRARRAAPRERTPTHQPTERTHEVRRPDPLTAPASPIDEWALRETWYSDRRPGPSPRPLFAVGNGYLGLRGNVEEGRDGHAHGTFVNGFHETWPIRHAEEAFGFARIGQTIVNVARRQDDPALRRRRAAHAHRSPTCSDYERTLDFRDGVLRRSARLAHPVGQAGAHRVDRMVSFEHRHLAVHRRSRSTLLDADAPVAISSPDPQPPGRHATSTDRSSTSARRLRPAQGRAVRRAGAAARRATGRATAAQCSATAAPTPA